MALSAELLLTLQQLKGVGSKTILKIAEQIVGDIKNIEDLCSYWKGLKGKKFESITEDDIIEAYDVAIRIINHSRMQNIGLIGYYDDVFPGILRETCNEEGKLDPPLLLWY